MILYIYIFLFVTAVEITIIELLQLLADASQLNGMALIQASVMTVLQMCLSVKFTIVKI